MAVLDQQLRAALVAVPRQFPATTAPLAAVLLPLRVGVAGDEVVFTVRPTNLRLHAGQIGFPGGRRDGEETPSACALREAEEELGIPPAAVDLLGALPPRWSSSGLLVHCLVGRLAPVALRPAPAEVARVLAVPFAALADDRRWQDRPPPAGAAAAAANAPPTSPHFQHDGDLLWGLTARFVRDLFAHLRGSPDAPH